MIDDVLSLPADPPAPRLEELLAQIARLDRERDRLATAATIANFQRHINRTVSAAALEQLAAVDPADPPHRAPVHRDPFTREDLIVAWGRSDRTYAGFATTLAIPEGSVAFYLHKVSLTLTQLRSMELA